MAKDELIARPKWIPGGEFEDRPANKSGVERAELVRLIEDQTQFLAVKIPCKNKYKRVCGGKIYSGDVLEVRVIEIK
jgi:hypothetical protein